MKTFLLSIFLISSITIFSQSQALTQLVYEIRDPETSPVRFRKAVETIGEYLALNVLEELSTQESTIRTLTGADAKHHLIQDVPVLVTVLRAGLPLNAGVQRVFPNAEVGFLAMSRDEETLKAKTEYVALPHLKDKYVILSDTMLATGGSLLDAIRVIEQQEPKKIFVIAAIASKPGIARILEYNSNITVFAAAVDPSLSEKGYIIPGLGDAGDRSYGKKYISVLSSSVPSP